ncbi:unnamed protein product, partial [Gulo gulo]
DRAGSRRECLLPSSISVQTLVSRCAGQLSFILFDHHDVTNVTDQCDVLWDVQVIQISSIL